MMATRRSPGQDRVCPDCGLTGDADDTKNFLTNGSTRCRECSRRVARERYPERREEIARKRRHRRDVLQSSADDGKSLAPLLWEHRMTLKIRNWIRYGAGDMEPIVGHPWRSISDMLEKEDLDREDLGLTWDVDLTSGFRFEDWVIRRI